MAIGHKILGSGSEHVIIMHDWYCDSTSYDQIIPYLDMQQCTYLFPDVRGYGTSKNIPGEYTAAEAAQDVIALADDLGWNRFHLVGHSMSGMIIQYIVMSIPNRVKGAVAITPVPASGSPIPEDAIDFVKDAAMQNDQAAQQIVHLITGNRYTNQFAKFKVQRWREVSIEKARLGYLNMFTQTNFADKIKGISTPYLVIIGVQDADGYSEQVMRDTFLSAYPNAELFKIENSGHYPMQETPVLLASAIEKFVTKYSD